LYEEKKKRRQPLCSSTRKGGEKREAEQHILRGTEQVREAERETTGAKKGTSPSSLKKKGKKRPAELHLVLQAAGILAGVSRRKK